MTRVTHMVLAALLVVCAARMAIFPAAASEPATAVATTSTDDAGIPAAVEALHAHATGHRLILLGESHGTQEIPRFVQALVTRYAVEGPVLLGVEIPATEQASLDAFLRSPGAAAGREAVLHRPWWTRHDNQHDGRRSYDMLDLFDGLRRLRAQGRIVRVLAYDVGEHEQHAGNDWRDERMAEAIRAAYGANAHAVVLVLAGNVHAMLARPDDIVGPVQKTAGQWLADLHPESVRIAARGGASWACVGHSCKAFPADRSVDANGAMPGPYTFGVVLGHFSVARLVGAGAP